MPLFSSLFSSRVVMSCDSEYAIDRATSFETEIARSVNSAFHLSAFRNLRKLLLTPGEVSIQRTGRRSGVVASCSLQEVLQSVALSPPYAK
jgi:hypothetical protein